MASALHVAKNTFFIAFSNVGTKIIAFFITIYLARYLGVSDFGKYTFIITYLMMFSFVASFGLDPVVIRNISKKPEQITEIMSNSLVIRFITALIAIIFSIVCIYILNYPSDTILYVKYASIILLFQGISYLVESLFQAKLKMEYSAISQISSKLIFGIAVFFLIRGNYGITYIIFAYIFSELVRTLISFSIAKKIVNFHPTIEKKRYQDLIVQALPFVLGYGLAALFNRFDILMLSIMQGETAVGYYSAPYKLTESILFIPSALAGSLMPVMAKQFEKQKEKLEYTYSLGTRYIFLLLFPITIGGCVLGKDIIFLAFGDDFSDSIFVFQILTISIIFNSLNSIQTALLVAANKQQFNNIAVTICAVLNIILNFILIPKYDFIGAAVATLISVICLYWIGYYAIYKDLKIQPLKSILYKYILAAAIMSSIIIKLNMNIFLEILLGAIIYIIIIVSLKGIDKNDIALLKK
jgi:O-antigen/teichoic acid export membrane protein